MPSTPVPIFVRCQGVQSLVRRSGLLSGVRTWDRCARGRGVLPEQGCGGGVAAGAARRVAEGGRTATEVATRAVHRLAASQVEAGDVGDVLAVELVGMAAGRSRRARRHPRSRARSSQTTLRRVSRPARAARPITELVHVAVGLRARIWIPVASWPFIVGTVMVRVLMVSKPASRVVSHSREWWRQTAPSSVSNTP